MVGLRHSFRCSRLVTGCVLALTVFVFLLYETNFVHLQERLVSTPPVRNKANEIPIREHKSETDAGLNDSTHIESNPAKRVTATHVSREAATHASPETRHIAFLKVHKAGSSTIQNILYRFGLARNLTFVLATQSHYLAHSKYNYNEIISLPKDLGASANYDIACNHAVFNLDVYKKWMYPDAEYFAIVREPLDLLISAAYYYRDVWPSTYISNLNQDTFIIDLIRHPELYEQRPLASSRTFNYMTRDFGFVLNSTNDVLKVTGEKFERFLQQISDTFKLVLIMERFDESLVLLKRRYRWSIKDILYVKNNAYKAEGPPFSKRNLTSFDMKTFRRNYGMDIKIYNHFLKRFENQIKTEKGFGDEVNCFRKYLSDVQLFCSSIQQLNTITRILLHESECSEAFFVTVEDCSLMVLEELKFYIKLRQRHIAMLNSSDIGNN